MKLTGIKKRYGENVVFDGFDFEFEEGKITALLGSSGCGKTTLLNIVSGLTDYEGQADTPERVSYIFQRQRLVPNLTVYGNLDYVLSDIKDKNERKRVINEILDKIELTDYAEKYPSSLSGGMAQRVSLGRAFVYSAPIILMDEPFKELDVSLKKRIIKVFEKLYESDGRTVLFVTHDIDEALILADRIVVLEKGGKIALDEKIDVPRQDRNAGDFSELKNSIYEVL